MEGSIWSGVPGTLMSAPSPIHRRLSLGASGQESPPIAGDPSGPTGLLHPSVLTRTRDPSHPLRDSPTSGTPRGRQGRHGSSQGAPRPLSSLEGSTVALRGPASWGLPLPSRWLAIAPGHGGWDRHSRRQGAIGSKAGCPPGTSCLFPCGESGSPYEAPPCRGYPLSSCWACPSRPARHSQAGVRPTDPGREGVC